MSQISAVALSEQRLQSWSSQWHQTQSSVFRSWRLIEAVRGVPSATPVLPDITGAPCMRWRGCLSHSISTRVPRSLFFLTATTDRQSQCWQLQSVIIT